MRTLIENLMLYCYGEDNKIQIITDKDSLNKHKNAIYGNERYSSLYTFRECLNDSYSHYTSSTHKSVSLMHK